MRDNEANIRDIQGNTGWLATLVKPQTLMLAVNNLLIVDY